MDEDAHGIDSVTITEEDVIDQLSILYINKTYGPDKIPPRPLK